MIVFMMRKKPTRTKKSDWPSDDVLYFVDGKKRPIAYSTCSTSNLLGILSEDNPSFTIQQVKELINYDQEAINVCDAYIERGYGDLTANFEY